MLGFLGVLAVTSSGAIDDVSLRALGLIGGIAAVAHVSLGVRNHHALNARGWISRGRYSGRTVPWTVVVDVTWKHGDGPYASGGVSATMMSIRRSFVGPWEIVARSCDGGFVAEQRVVRTGVVVTREPVRESLAEAKADGVRLVRDAVVAASSTHE